MRAAAHVLSILGLLLDDPCPVAAATCGVPIVWEVWKPPLDLGGQVACQGRAEVDGAVRGHDPLEQRCREGLDVGLGQLVRGRVGDLDDREAALGDLLRHPICRAHQIIRQRLALLVLLGRSDAAAQHSKLHRGWGSRQGEREAAQLLYRLDPAVGAAGRGHHLFCHSPLELEEGAEAGAAVLVDHGGADLVVDGARRGRQV